MGETARVRPVPVRLLALACAVGLAGLLVGLSVAPRRLPGDTFHVTPKAVAGASIVLGQVDGLHALPQLSPDIVAGILPAALLIVAAWFAGVLWFRPEHPTRPGRVFGGRGPPTSR